MYEHLHISLVFIKSECMKQSHDSRHTCAGVGTAQTAQITELQSSIQTLLRTPAYLWFLGTNVWKTALLHECIFGLAF